MSKKNKKVHYCLILDRSGSMNRNVRGTVDAYNEQVQQIKEDAKDGELDIDVSLFTFNKDTFEHLWCVPVDQIQEATEESYNPAGGTCMYNAIGHVVKKYQEMDDFKDENTTYLLNIISDGESEGDKIYTKQMVNQILQPCHASKRWTVSFMGCANMRLNEVSQTLGINLGNVAVWNPGSELDNAYSNKVMRASTNKYMNARKSSAEPQEMHNFYSANENVAMDCNISSKLADSGQHTNSVRSRGMGRVLRTSGIGGSSVSRSQPLDFSSATLGSTDGVDVDAFEAAKLSMANRTNNVQNGSADVFTMGNKVNWKS